MLYSGIAAALLGGVGLYGMVTAHFARTRQVALTLLLMAGIEVWLGGVLDAGAVLALTAVLWLLRAAAVVLCVKAVREDRRAWERREQRKASCRRRMRCAQVPVHALPQAEESRRAVPCA